MWRCLLIRVRMRSDFFLVDILTYLIWCGYDSFCFLFTILTSIRYLIFVNMIGLQFLHLWMRLFYFHVVILLVD